MRDAENRAPAFEVPDEPEAALAARPSGGDARAEPHEARARVPRPVPVTSTRAEEVHVVLRGSARVKVEDEIVELGELDAIRFGRNTMPAVEVGPDGVEYLAFGAGDDPRDAELVQGWWSE